MTKEKEIKKTAKKKPVLKCADCTHYNSIDCTHRSNIGIKVQYRREYTYYIKKPQQLNSKGGCKNYAKA